MLCIDMDVPKGAQTKSFSEIFEVMEWIWSYLISDSVGNYLKLSDMNTNKRHVRHTQDTYTQYEETEWLNDLGMRKFLFLEGHVLGLFHMLY